MARSGLPEDTTNRRVDPCGCVWWYCAAPVNGYVKFDRCPEHPKKAS